MTLGTVTAVVAVHVAVAIYASQHGWVSLTEGLSAVRPERALVLVGGQYQPLIVQGELWRLVTSAWLHVDGLHLLSNVVGLLLVGWWFEPRLGSGVVASTLVWGALAGSVLPSVVGVVRSDGASGAVFALLAAGVIQAWWATEEDEEGQFIYRVFGVLLVLNLVFSFLHPAVDAAGHLGGAVAGALWGVLAIRMPRGVHGLVVAGWMMATVAGFILVSQ